MEESSVGNFTQMNMCMVHNMQKAYAIIDAFPKNSHGRPYLVDQKWRKVFFDVFVRKYGLDWSKCQYLPQDVNRRIKLVEFFGYILREFVMFTDTKAWYFKIKTAFYVMIIKKTGWTRNQRYIALSFYW
jgi:hypothetical protein